MVKSDEPAVVANGGFPTYAFHVEPLLIETQTVPDTVKIRVPSAEQLTGFPPIVPNTDQGRPCDTIIDGLIEIR